MISFESVKKPEPLVGVGLRHLHYSDALDKSIAVNQHIDFVEIHAENFFAKGGITKALLQDVCEQYELSVHGTSLGLGSQVAIENDVLNKFANLVEFTQPKLVSEHLCFNRAKISGNVLHSGDLLPIAYNQSSLKILDNNIDLLQSRINRPILIENLSAYLSLPDLSSGDTDENILDQYSEWEFLQLLCKQSGCGLLLDINNLIVNELNKQFASNAQKLSENELIQAVMQSIHQIDPKYIGEIHLAGFSEKQVEGFIVDDHAQAVSNMCWSVYKQTIAHCPNVPTLVEWDNNLPSWEVLTNEALKAKQLLG